MTVSRETRARLSVFADLLTRWNRRINLIAPSDEPHIWERHIGDSLQLADFLASSTLRAADFGSGAGFPGIVIAITTGISFELVEADRRKAAFLVEAVRLTDAPARVHATRVQDARFAPVDLVTSRALAGVSELLALAAPRLTVSGECLFLKGIGVEAEVETARHQWSFEASAIQSRTKLDSCVLRIAKLRPHKSAF